MFPAILILSFIFIGFATSAAPEFADVQIPGTGDGSQPIPVSVNLTSDVPVSEVRLFYEMEGWAYPIIAYLFRTNGTATDGTWSGEIPPLNEGGTLRCSIIVDVDGGIARYPAEGTVSIDVEGPGKGFPWMWVVIAGFLAFVFVATELIFKPGIYRPTGRERVRALEEKDRKKAMEDDENSEVDIKDEISESRKQPPPETPG